MTDFTYAFGYLLGAAASVMSFAAVFVSWECLRSRGRAIGIVCGLTVWLLGPWILYGLDTIAKANVAMIERLRSAEPTNVERTKP